MHQFGTKVLSEMFMGYVFERGEGRSWTGDLLTVDSGDLKTMPPSEILVKEFKSKELDIQTRDNEFVFPCNTGVILQ